jgi:hypothetical protein
MEGHNVVNANNAHYHSMASIITYDSTFSRHVYALKK